MRRRHPADRAPPQTATQQRLREGGGAVVVGVDASDASLAALEWALEEAALRATPCQVVRAWSEPKPPYPGDWRQGPAVDRIVAAERGAPWIVAQAHGRTGVSQVAVEADAPYGHPKAVLLDRAPAAACLVVGSRGRGPSPRRCSARSARRASTERPARSW